MSNVLQDLEQSCADVELHRPVETHMLALMVRGIFTSLQFPYAHFPTQALSGDSLFAIIWEAVEHLERLGLKVIVLTGDGPSPNGKFFQLHAQQSGVCYKVLNPYAEEERFVYFVRGSGPSAEEESDPGGEITQATSGGYSEGLSSEASEELKTEQKHPS